MAILLSEMPESFVGEALPHKTWTRTELELLESTGVLAERHFELIEGELIDKMGKKRKHVSATSETLDTLKELFGSKFVNSEAPIDVAPEDNSANEPEPDVIVLRRPSRSFEANPAPADLALVVEISESTLRQDLSAKARLYARAGILEYWVLDVKSRRLHVLREPSTGTYQVHLEFAESEFVSPLAKPDRAIAVAALLP